MTILEDLWYGNVRPTERSIQRGGRLDNLMKLLCQNEDDLMSGLTEKQKENVDLKRDIIGLQAKLETYEQESRAMKDENLELQKRLIRMEAEIDELRRRL